MKTGNSELRLILAASLVVLGGCSAAVRARRVHDASAGSALRGITYYLPQTVVVVSVPLARISWAPGLYSDLLPYYFPCPPFTVKDARPSAPPVCGVEHPDKPYTAPAVSFDLDDTTATTRPERDPAQIFSVDYKSHWYQWFVDRKFGLEMSETGIPTRVTAEATDHTLEFVGQVLKSGASVYSKALTGGILSAGQADVARTNAAKEALSGRRPGCVLTDQQTLFAQFLPDADLGFFCALASPFREQYMKMPYALEVRFREYAGIPPDLPRISHFLDAFQVFQRIADATKKREDLLDATTGDQSIEVFNARLKALEDEIAADSAAFFGVSRRRVIWTGQFEIRSAISKSKAFTWTEDKGICDASPGDGILSISTAPATHSDCTNPRSYSISLTTGDTAAKDSPKANTGFFYRIPGQGKLDVFTGDNRTFNANFAIAQFGAIAALPESTGGRRSAVTVELYGSTGAIRTLSIASDAAVDKSLIADSETAANSVIDARAKAAKPSAAPDPLADLERRRKILEEQIKIRDLQEKLSGSNLPDTSGTP